MTRGVPRRWTYMVQIKPEGDSKVVSKALRFDKNMQEAFVKTSECIGFVDWKAVERNAKSEDRAIRKECKILLKNRDNIFDDTVFMLD